MKIIIVNPNNKFEDKNQSRVRIDMINVSSNKEPYYKCLFTRKNNLKDYYKNLRATDIAKLKRVTNYEPIVEIELDFEFYEKYYTRDDEEIVHDYVTSFGTILYNHHTPKAINSLPMYLMLGNTVIYSNIERLTKGSENPTLFKTKKELLEYNLKKELNKL